ncbi:hypothetical protein TNCV_4330501, partial [Trichonephila clavipes]
MRISNPQSATRRPVSVEVDATLEFCEAPRDFPLARCENLGGKWVSQFSRGLQKARNIRNSRFVQIIRPPKFDKRVCFVAQISLQNGFCGNRPKRWAARDAWEKFFSRVSRSAFQGSDARQVLIQQKRRIGKCLNSR